MQRFLPGIFYSLSNTVSLKLKSSKPPYFRL